MIKPEDIINIAKFFTIISHTPGRLRVRVNPKITQSSLDVSLNDINDLPSKINGINDIKINKIIASVTISYNPDIFQPKLWNDLINDENTEEITSIINKLAKELK